MAKHNDTGSWGEDLAAQYLQGQGYVLRDRDWRYGHRDLDLVVTTPDGTTVVFVEVKTRTSDIVTHPEDAIDQRKIRNIGLAANDYVKLHDVQEPLRFDIVTVIGKDAATATVSHMADAFNPLMAY